MFSVTSLSYLWMSWLIYAGVVVWVESGVVVEICGGVGGSMCLVVMDDGYGRVSSAGMGQGVTGWVGRTWIND